MTSTKDLEQGTHAAISGAWLPEEADFAEGDGDATHAIIIPTTTKTTPTPTITTPTPTSTTTTTSPTPTSLALYNIYYYISTTPENFRSL